MKRHPFGLTVGEMFEWGYRLAFVLGFIAILYLNSRYATNEDLAASERRVGVLRDSAASMSSRIDELDKSDHVHSIAAEKSEAILSEVKTGLAELRATQLESAKNTETNFVRIFDKLDNLPAARRSP
jgi:hypothetical protein